MSDIKSYYYYYWFIIIIIITLYVCTVLPSKKNNVIQIISIQLAPILMLASSDERPEHVPCTSRGDHLSPQMRSRISATMMRENKYD